VSSSNPVPRRVQYEGDLARPRYHFTAPTGWINDPNGLSQWDGTYHLFYQFNPDGPEHRRILWGHATSANLVNWADAPIALTPDPDGPDRDGCWSGVLVDDGGTPTIVYSAHDGDRQLPSLAFGDPTLTTWTKFEGNPVIDGPPPGLPVTAFRDHCVWREGDRWMQLIGSGIEGIGGAALLYESPDLREWTYRGPILVGQTPEAGQLWTGSMWECVDLFELDGRHVLVASVWDEGVTHFPVYFSGSYRDGVFTGEPARLLDLGLRFCYAPQSFLDDQGRRILFGWMQEGRDDALTRRGGWSGCLTVPRVLTWHPDGTLHQEPVAELAALRRDSWERGPVHLEPGTTLDLAPAGSMALDLELMVTAQAGAVLELDLLAADDDRERTTITIDWASATMGLDRTHSSLEPADTSPLGGAIPLADGALRLRVLVDHSAIEVFANGVALAARAYPTGPESSGMRMRAIGGPIQVESATAWRLAGASDATMSTEDAAEVLPLV
jgi:beta-fructofuranosidase